MPQKPKGPDDELDIEDLDVTDDVKGGRSEPRLSHEGPASQQQRPRLRNPKFNPTHDYHPASEQ